MATEREPANEPEPVNDDVRAPARVSEAMIAKATVTAENENYFPKSLTSATDAKGRFSILGLRTATYKLTVRAEGYETAAISFPVRMAQPNPPIDLRLVRKLAPGPPPLLANIDSAKLQKDLDSAAELAGGGKTDEAIVHYRAAVTSLRNINDCLCIFKWVDGRSDPAGAETLSA